MSIDQNQAPSTCGCCKVGDSPTPHAIQNRPGLSGIHYRVGTYSSFLLAMTEQIARTNELRQRWLTRSTDDFGIALLAMWAYVADILTFYQERIANEAFLRTALFQESVARLAALLDYKPAPGAAAEADLAFFLEQSKRVQIPVGLRVQSVPGQNEKPQKFETIQAITADAALNQVQIFPQPAAYAPFAQGNSQAILLSDPKGLAPRIKLAIFSPLRTELKQVSSLSLKNTQQILAWTPAIQSSDFDSFITQVAVYGNESRLFGYNAPDSFVQTTSDTTAAGGIKFTLLKAPYTDGNSNLPASADRLVLDAQYKDLKVGDTVLLSQAGSTDHPEQSFARLAKIKNVSTEAAKYGPLQGAVSWLTLDFGVAATPAVALGSSFHLHVFVIGDDGALWTKSPGVWQSLGGQIDRLAVGTNQDGRLEIFARGKADQALWHIWQTPGGSWSSWASLGGQIDLLAVASNKDGRLEVLASGLDQALWHIGQTAPNSNNWSGWASLGGTIDLLAVASNLDGRLEVFARGTDQGLWHIRQTAPNSNNWSDWNPIGGSIDLLAVGSNLDGRLEVFARGTDQGLWHIRQTAPNSNNWSGWDPLGGTIDRLAVAANQDGRVEVFARGTDQGMRYNSQIAPNSNSWSGWAPLPGQKIDGFAVGNNQDGRLEIYAQGIDRALWDIWQTAPNADNWIFWFPQGVPMWPISDRDRVTVYSVSHLLEFSQFRYGDSISGSAFYVPLAKLQSVDSKRSIILDDSASNPQTVQVDSAQQVDTDRDGRADHWLIAFTPGLNRSLATATAAFFGNVCASSHGQTIANEVLGDGDASTTFQSFRLQKSPVTFVHKAGAPHGVKNTLQIQLSSVIWNEVPEFFGHDGNERVFVTSIDAKGMTVRFSDGFTGSRLLTGRGNVVATYRQGIGVVGNVAAGALRTLLDRPVGLKNVTNPGLATGGADPESLDQTRANAPNSVRTFGRIVSLRDFEDAARGFAGIAKAHAYSGWSGEEQIVYVTVAGVAGAAVTGNVYSDLVADLNSRRDPNRALVVQSYTKVAVRMAAIIYVNPDHVADDVLAAVRSAVTTYFSFDNQQFGQPVHLSNVYSLLQGVDGVSGADVITLQFKNPGDASTHGATADPVQVHLRIDDAELAVLEDPANDALITSRTT